MAVAPVLGGTTLADVTDFDYTAVPRGTTNEMADGTIVVDFINVGAGAAYRKLYKLAWNLLTDGEADSVETAYWAAVVAGTATFVSPESESTNVMPTEKPKLTRKAVKKAGNNQGWNVEIELLQI